MNVPNLQYNFTINMNTVKRISYSQGVFIYIPNKPMEKNILTLAQSAGVILSLASQAYCAVLILSWVFGSDLKAKLSTD